MRIEETESPMLASQRFSFHHQTIKSTKNLPDLIKISVLPKIRNQSTEFVTPNVSQIIFN
jgi:hypothetical protein